MVLWGRWSRWGWGAKSFYLACSNASNETAHVTQSIVHLFGPPLVILWWDSTIIPYFLSKCNCGFLSIKELRYKCIMTLTLQLIYFPPTSEVYSIKYG